MTGPRPRVARRPRRRAPPIEAGRHAPPGPRAARHGQNPALEPRRLPAHPWSRPRSPARTPQHGVAIESGPVPGHQNLDSFDLTASRIARPTFEYLASLEWIAAKENPLMVGPAGTGKSDVPTSPSPGRQPVNDDERPRQPAWWFIACWCCSVRRPSSSWWDRLAARVQSGEVQKALRAANRQGTMDRG